MAGDKLEGLLYRCLAGDYSMTPVYLRTSINAITDSVARNRLIRITPAITPSSYA